MAKNVAVVIDKTSGQPLMVVVPDHDSQLSDPSFNPANGLQVLVPIENSRVLTHHQLQEVIERAAATFKNMSPVEIMTSKSRVEA